MIRVLDWEVGKIIGALKEKNCFENTLILFTSDNGGLGSGVAKQKIHNSSGGLRGSKNSPYEGGHRVPFIACWPDRIKEKSISHSLVNGTDLVATFASIVGTQIDGTQAMDSFDISRILLREKDFPGRGELLLQAGSKHELIYRVRQWKLIIQSNHKLTKFEPIALFDLESNPHELEEKNLVNHSSHKDRIETMLSKYMEIRKSAQRTTPVFRPIAVSQ